MAQFNSVSTSSLIIGLLIFGNAHASEPASIYAGPDLTISLQESAKLEAVVTDTQPPYLTIGWTKESGPGEVIFANKHSASTTATFTAPGDYTLMLGGYDGSVAYDFVMVTVTR